MLVRVYTTEEFVQLCLAHSINLKMTVIIGNAVITNAETGQQELFVIAQAKQHDRTLELRFLCGAHKLTPECAANEVRKRVQDLLMLALKEIPTVEVSFGSIALAS